MVQIFIWYGSHSGVWWQRVLKIAKREKNEHHFFFHVRQPLISGHFFTIPCKNPLKTFALTHFSIVNFAIESEFDVNWTLGMLKDAQNCIFW